MPKKFDLHKHTLYLRAGDYQFLQESLMKTDVSAGEVIRNTVARLVDNIKGSRSSLEVELKELEL